MTIDLPAIENTIKTILKKHVPPLKIRQETKSAFEVAGTKETMQGKQKVDGYYFASVVPKPKDIRLYFFPIYTHADQFKQISEQLRKCLKGKSCFHIKKLDQDLQNEISQMVQTGIKIYEKENLI